MNETDILIILEDYLRRQETPFIVNFSETDSELKLPDGSTEAYLERGLAEISSELKITERGEQAVKVEKVVPPVVWA